MRTQMRAAPPSRPGLELRRLLSLSLALLLLLALISFSQTDPSWTTWTL